mmetsp:Transcript_69789/g.226991  ORF Transcript_69789/g.226991 Transcript_69789/m.226991 type:complete len:1019 (-) Transcript_69789:261-3317(-)
MSGEGSGRAPQPQPQPVVSKSTEDICTCGFFQKTFALNGVESGSATGGASADSHTSELVKAVTTKLVETYNRCSKDYQYSLESAPKRVLTKITEATHNNGWDNGEHDYICKVGDTIMNEAGRKTYEIQDWLGQGTFGQVIKVQQQDSPDVPQMALKIIKNKPAYFNQARVEVKVLSRLNTEFDAEDKHRIIRMLDYFVWRKHLCVVFELLSMNLYDVLKQNYFKGVTLNSIRVVSMQLLEALSCLRKAMIIHCDLKPENVMISDLNPLRIKLIDFGSACPENNTMHTYIQSRFYRSPEVLLGLPYTAAIDMWSLGCIAAELYLGLPIFPGHSEFDQVCRIVNVLGPPPARMLALGSKTKRYFRKEDVEGADRGSADGAEGSAATRASGAPTGGDGDKASIADATGAGKGGDSTATASAARAVPSEKAQAPASSSSASAAAAAPDKPKEADTPSGSGADSAPAAAIAATEGCSGSAGGGQTATGSRAGADSSTTANSGGEQPQTSAQASSSGDGPKPVKEGAKEEQAEDGEESQEEEEDPSDATEERKGQPECSSAANSSVPEASGGRRRLRLRANHGGVPQRRRVAWRIKTAEEYMRDELKKVGPSKKYFNFHDLSSMVDCVPQRPNLTAEQIKIDKERRQSFLQFLGGVLNLNPEERWTPKEALQHNLVNCEASFDLNFQPTREQEQEQEATPAVPEDKEQAKISLVDWSSAPSAPSASANSSAGSSASSPAGSSSRGMRSTGWGSGGGRSGVRPVRHALGVGSLNDRMRSLKQARGFNSSATVTPASSPGQGSSAVSASNSGAAAAAGGAGSGTGRGQQCGNTGSSSPWHLPSPMSEQSTGTASERMPSSHYSGTDSGGELLSRGSVSQSDSGWRGPRSSHLSDSDGASAGADDRPLAQVKESYQKSLWGSIRSVTQAEISRHLPPRMDPALSPGSSAGVTFREAVGMSKSGPVVGRGAAAAAVGGSSSHTSGHVGGALGSGTGSAGAEEQGNRSFLTPARAASNDSGSGGGGAKR